MTVMLRVSEVVEIPRGFGQVGRDWDWDPAAFMRSVPPKIKRHLGNHKQELAIGFK